MFSIPTHQSPTHQYYDEQLLLSFFRQHQEEAAKLLMNTFFNLPSSANAENAVIGPVKTDQSPEAVAAPSMPQIMLQKVSAPIPSSGSVAFISNLVSLPPSSSSSSSSASIPARSSSFSCSSSSSSSLSPTPPPLPSSCSASSSDPECPSDSASGPIRPCQWDQCSRSFRSPNEFLEHIRLDHLVHLHLATPGPRQFVCRWRNCDRGQRPFAAIYMLVQHLRAHTGEKPYKCEWPDCEKRYSRLENLKTHQRKHTGERPYQCGVCQRCFTNASDKAKHVNRVHKEKKQYHCSVPGCASSYTDPSSLRKHTLASHGKTPWMEYKASRRNGRRRCQSNPEGMGAKKGDGRE